MIKRTLTFMTICLFSVSIFSSIEHNWDDLEGAEMLGPSQDNEFKSPEEMLRQMQAQALENSPLFQAVLNQDTPAFKEELEKIGLDELLTTINIQTASGDSLINTMAKISELNLLKTVQAQTNFGDTRIIDKMVKVSELDLSETIQTQTNSGDTLLDPIRENQELNPNQFTLQMQLLVKRLLELGLEKGFSIRLLYHYIDTNNGTFWSIITRNETRPPLIPYASQINLYTKSKLFYTPTKKLLSRFKKWGRIQNRLQDSLSIASGAITALSSFWIILSIINGNLEEIHNLSEGGKVLTFIGTAVPVIAGTNSVMRLGRSAGQELGAKFCKNMFLKKK